MKLTVQLVHITRCLALDRATKRFVFQKPLTSPPTLQLNGSAVFEIVLVAIGLATLIAGGEFLLRGAAKVASALGMTRLMIGLTIVSLGTSAPETAICVDAALQAKPEIALGNIVGSNIANVLLILGTTAIVFPIVIDRKIIQREVPIMIGVTCLFVALASDGILTQTDGGVLLFGMICFLVWQFISARQEPQALDSDETKVETGKETNADSGIIEKYSFLKIAMFILLGGAMLWFGAGWMVKGATGIASAFGTSELVIGLTIVAIGSSSPEIVTSLLAARRGYPEMAVGSVIGSNIANLLLVGGTTAVLSAEITVPVEAFEFDIPVMAIASVACLPIFLTDHKIARCEGVLFLLCFIAFTGFLFFRSSLSGLFPSWNQMVWPIAIPLILATFMVIVYRHFFKNSIE